MQTITDITFNNNIYSQVRHWVVVLYQIDGVALVIPLSNIDLLTYMQPFDEIPGCQNHITTNNHKTFTLFAYSENIATWFWNNNVIPENLDEIIIFCPFADEKDYWRKWTRRYTQKIKNVITYDAFEREALIFGMKYIDDLRLHFKNNGDILNILEDNYTRMCLALSNSFGRAANRQ